MAEELFDILDENGKLTGKTKPRSQVHKDGDWHKTVHTWILNSKGQVLLQKRSKHTESFPDYWDISSAGHILAGHDSLQSALKELSEELGIEVALSEIKYIFTDKQSYTIKNGTFINKEYNDVYLLKKDIDVSKLKLDPLEVSEVKFIDLKKLDHDIKNKNIKIVPRTPKYLMKLFKVFYANI